MKKLGFIGGGNMAEALAHGLIQHKLFKPADIIVSDVAPERRRFASCRRSPPRPSSSFSERGR